MIPEDEILRTLDGDWVNWDAVRDAVELESPSAPEHEHVAAVEEAADLASEYLLADLTGCDAIGVEQRLTFDLLEGLRGACRVDLIRYGCVVPDGLLAAREIIDWKRTGSLGVVTMERYARSLQPHWYIEAASRSLLDPALPHFVYRFLSNGKKAKLVVDRFDPLRVQEAAQTIRAYSKLFNVEAFSTARSPGGGCRGCRFSAWCWEDGPKPQWKPSIAPWTRSDAEALLECPRKGLWGWNAGRESGESDNPAIRRGLLLHAGIAEIYLQALAQLGVEPDTGGVYLLK